MSLGARRLAMCLAVVIAAAGAGCAAPLPFTVTPGVHSVLQSSLSREEALELQQEADRAVEGMCAFLSLPIPEIRAEITLFDSRRALKRHLAVSCPVMADAAAACYETPHGTLIIALSRHRQRSETARLLRHELSHYVIASHFEDIPPWIDEGLAQFFETGSPYGRAHPRKQRSLARQLHGGRGDAVAALVAVAPGTRLNRKQYALAWGMTRYLLAKGPDGPARIRRYLETVHSGEDAAAQFTENFGASLPEIRTSLHAQMTHPPLPDD